MTDPASAPVRVLFVGNSLTYANDLPAIVEQLGRHSGHRIQTAMIAFPNFSLADHLAQGDAARRIAREPWDLVVLQQGPSGLPESGVDLIASTRQFADLCRPRRAEVALYGVWPASDRPTAFDSVTANYQAAAEAVDGRFFPAGKAWVAAWQRAPALPLYGPDGFHPSPTGSLLAALVIHRGITRQPLATLPGDLTVNGTPLPLTSDQAAILLAAAEAAYVEMAGRH